MRWTEILKRIKGRENVKGAEIGVMKGETAQHLLMQPNVDEYWCIDIWEYDQDYADTSKHATRFSSEYHERNLSTFLKMAANYPRNVRILTMASEEAALYIPPDYLDFVFIDGNHSYKYIKEDIMLWLPRIKSGGFLGGHDYHDQIRFGVKRAVNEIFVDHDITLGEDCTWFVNL